VWIGFVFAKEVGEHQRGFGEALGPSGLANPKGVTSVHTRFVFEHVQDVCSEVRIDRALETGLECKLLDSDVHDDLRLRGGRSERA
jgi:hypothetical protein